MNSGGRYFTIPDEDSSKTFINGIIVNGLTKKDNPQGDDTTLLAGLDVSHFINGSQTQTMSYTARAKEQLDFTIQSVDAGSLTAQAVFSGTVLAKTQSSSLFGTFSVVAPSAGQIDIKVSAQNANDNSIFIVGVTSNLPAENCTVGVGPPSSGSGPSSVAKIVAPTISCVALVGGLALLYWLYKYYYLKHPRTHGPVTTGDPSSNVPQTDKGVVIHSMAIPPSKVGSIPWFKFPSHPPRQPPKPNNNNSKDTDNDSDSEDSCPENSDNENDSNQASDPSKHRIHKIKTYGNNHHHHIQAQHPCFNERCPIASHVCEDTQHPCTCVDPKCKLNSRGHKCKDENALHICAGPENDPLCPLNDPEYAKMKKQEHDGLVNKYKAQDMAKKGLKMAAKHVVSAAGGLPV
jgi:hypothetical protein